MVSRVFTIKNSNGLHLKPAAALCTEAIKYQASITLTSEQTTVSAKSLLSVLSACVKFAQEITVTCEGEDEKEALENVGRLIMEGLGE